MSLAAGGTNQSLTIYTVGHSNQSLECFIALLQRHSMQSLADVRSAPYSRYVPHFNRRELEGAVARRGIRYTYLGDELGGRPSGDEFYDEDDHVLYYRVACALFFLRGLRRLADEAALYRTAIMCGEEDPSNCHRHLLIARVLDRQGVRVLHVRANDDEQAVLRPPPTLWDAALSPIEEEATWKSIRSVSRSRPPSGSSNPSDESESDDL